MQDQVAKFSSKGVVAAFVGGLQVNNSVQDEALSDTVQLLYFSPEVLLSMPVWREMLRSPCYQENIVCLAVDEAHLVEKWCVLYNFSLV